MPGVPVGPARFGADFVSGYAASAAPLAAPRPAPVPGPRPCDAFLGCTKQHPQQRVQQRGSGGSFGSHSAYTNMPQVLQAAGFVKQN